MAETSSAGGYFLGSVTISSKGQVVIPQRVRELFDLHTGDQLIVLGTPEQAGFALLKPEGFLRVQQQLAGLAASVAAGASLMGGAASAGVTPGATAAGGAGVVSDAAARDGRAPKGAKARKGGRSGKRT